MLLLAVLRTACGLFWKSGGKLTEDITEYRDGIFLETKFSTAANVGDCSGSLPNRVAERPSPHHPCLAHTVLR